MDATTSQTGPKDGLDKLGLAIEIAKANGNPDWDDLAARLGSASAASLKKTWQNLKNSHVIRRKGEEDPLSPKTKKVTKPKTPRKKTTPKKSKKPVEEDSEMDAEFDEEVDISGDEAAVKAEE